MSVLRKSASSVGIGAANLANWWMRRGAGAANVLEINLAGPVAEETHLAGIWQKLLPPQLISMRELLAALDFGAEDPDLKVLLLRISDHDLGWGRAEELCEAIRRFRAAGKYALAFLEEPENIDTMIAANCDRIAMPPGTTLYLTGLLSEVMYLKGLLDKLDVEPEIFQAGKYKSAAEPYMRSAMSSEHREAVEAMLDNIFDRWVSALAQGRGLAPE
jgi:protease IV